MLGISVFFIVYELSKILGITEYFIFILVIILFPIRCDIRNIFAPIRSLICFFHSQACS